MANANEEETFTPGQRILVLAASMLSWMSAGVELGLGPLTARPAAIDLLFDPGVPLTVDQENLAGAWFARFIAAFLFGGAAGGWMFGTLADRLGRVKSLGLSVICFSVFTAMNAWARSPEELALLRFLASLGIGGTWASAVPLLAEAWPAASRPTVAGLLGGAGNLGIFIIALVGRMLSVGPDTWRTIALVGGMPFFLGVLVLLIVPESRQWQKTVPQRSNHLIRDAFTPPILSRTLIGIMLATVPLLGAWSSSKWLIPWADKVLDHAAATQAIWAGGATLGSLLGGWLANQFGRRTTYFTISVATLIVNWSVYRFLSPADPWFLFVVFVLGFIGTIFFGWLPLYLPELFPTRIRGTGAGITFNSGRILSGVGVLAAGSLMARFDGEYSRIGQVTAWIYLLGAIAILFAPDTTKPALADKEAS